MCSIWSWFVYTRLKQALIWWKRRNCYCVYIVYLYLLLWLNWFAITSAQCCKSIVCLLFLFFFLFITTTVNSIGNICISMSYSIWMSKLLFRRCCTKIVRVLVRSAYYLLLFWLIWFTNIYTNVISRVKLSLLLIVWFLVLPRLK